MHQDMVGMAIVDLSEPAQAALEQVRSEGGRPSHQPYRGGAVRPDHL